MGLSERAVVASRGISIHPSRVGWDFLAEINTYSVVIFQSTHPVWDGTTIYFRKAQATVHFNPPIPCGMGRHHSAW